MEAVEEVDVAKARRYSVNEKEHALARAVEVGNRRASEELGIPKGTIDGWRAALKRRKRAEEVETTAEGAEAITEGSSAPEERAIEEGSTAKTKRVARIYTPSERARALEVAAKKGVSAASRELGMTRFSIYDWRRKAQLFAEGKAKTTPIGDSDEDPEQLRDRRILEEWQTHPGLGPSQIRNQLRRSGMKVSVHRVRRTMEENGYVPPKVKRENAHDRRFEAIRPNHLWHADFLHRYINKLKIYVLILLDDHSRFITGWAIWEGERADIVMDTFEAATSRQGRPETLMSDGGSAFWSWRGVSQFTKLLEEMGIDQLIAKVPQINGKLEALNANVQKELFNQERFFDLAQTRQRLEAWVDFYNFRRTSHALGGLLVPADRYFGRSEAVLSRIEAGASPEGVGEALPVGQRHLDLLRVSSKGGQVEVQLMGQRLWPPAGMRG